MTVAADLNDAIRAKIVELAGASLQDVPEFSDAESIVELGLLDSPGIIQFIIWLEEQYRISIAERDVTVENLGSVASAARFTARMIDG